ncbi:GIY-YIG nuclease family protein [Agrococcus jejuensis]|uniref:GIY-YIG nuclease family protein n=1 Tax=Agrococcus jejuensis TaxID=399736 RepID=UPI0034D959CC
MKVGRAINVKSRLLQHLQGSRAHIPEPISVVRIFECEQDDLVRVEAMFHRLLATAGHMNPRRAAGSRSEVGVEWFQTNEAFLDAIAQALGLRTAYIGDAV